MFSRRVPADLALNRLAAAAGERRRAGQPFIDLTESNPTNAGFDYAPDLLQPLADPCALTYKPDPFGLREARSAVSADYARRGLAVAPDRIVLTASTSESYSLLFKILCDAGDEVVVPRPSYPLFEHLTRLETVEPRYYDIDYHGRWSIDVSTIEAQLNARTRAVLLVTPNNPTGSFVTPAELDAITRLCVPRGIAVIADEVFADYELAPGSRESAGQPLLVNDGLVFCLGGLSKSIGLPQVKLGWIAVAGSSSSVQAARERLELACDTYLSVSTPVQVAAGRLFERGAGIRRQIQSRVTGNYAAFLETATGRGGCGLLHAEGGWYAVLQVPTLGSEEDLAVDLLTSRGVLVHPGYFFDFPRESYVVVSLLLPEAAFREGAGRILGHFDCRARLA